MTSVSLTTFAFVVALLGWTPAIVFSWRLRRAEKDIVMLMRNASHQARDIGTTVVVVCDLRVAQDRLRDDLTDLRTERTADTERLKRAVRAAHVGRRSARRQRHVMQALALGSGSAAALCLRFGLDPDEVVGDEPGDDDSTGEE